MSCAKLRSASVEDPESSRRVRPTSQLIAARVNVSGHGARSPTPITVCTMLMCLVPQSVRGGAGKNALVRA